MKNLSHKTLLTVLAALLISFETYAQFKLTGEIRPRTEYRHGYKSLADSAQKNAYFIDQRTRLNFGYKAKGYQFYVTFQDVRTWGSQKQLVVADGLTTLHEAWGEAFISKKLGLKFGRQEIILDDHRIFGSVGWAQQARSHDAAILKFTDSTMAIQLGLAYNQDAAGLVGTSASNGSYKAFQYLWLHKDFGKSFGASFLFLNNGKEHKTLDTAGNVWSTKDNYSQTIGTRLSYKKEKLAVNGAFYYQAGVVADSANTKISAYLAGLDVSYKLSKAFSATLGFELISGQSTTDTTKAYTDVNHAFSPFYGTNHKFNGFMDYFYVGNHGGNVGLNDIFLKFKYKPKKFSVGLDLHIFLANAEVWDTKKYSDGVTEAVANGTPVADVPIEAMSSMLGTEIDLTVGFKLSEGVTVKAGYSQMFGTETLAIVKGVTDYQGNGRTDQTSNWAWLMIIIKPVLFDSISK